MAYIGTSPSQGVRHRYLFTATSGQTTFTGSDDDSRTLSYTDTKFMDVFLNGVLLDPNSDYTATTGSSVVLTSGASAGDLLEVIAFDTFSVFSGTFGGDVTVGGAFTSQGIDDNASSTAVTIDSSGNLLVGKTVTTLNTEGHALAPTFARFTRSGAAPVQFNRTSNDGDVVIFYKDGSTVGSIESSSGSLRIDSVGNFFGFTSGSSNYEVVWDAAQTGGTWRPGADNTSDIGYSARRWDDVYATNGTIQTSDRNEKQDIEELSEAEKRVAVACKGLLRKFRWKDSVAEKGDDARIHFGIIAQDLQDAFAAEGLDAGRYAMFISSTWWETQTEVSAIESDEENNIEAQDAYTRTDTYETAEEAPEGAIERTRLGVRYPELLAFIIGAM